MSVRVEFRIGRADGIESALFDSILPFQEWYRYLAADSTSGFHPNLLATIDAIARSGRTAFLPRSMHEAALLDTVVDIFIGDFCNCGPGSGMFCPANESMLNIRHYAALEARIEAFASTELARFWRFMLRGRPVARDAKTFPYHPSDPEFRVSFLLATEVGGVGDAMQRFRRAQIGRLTESEAAALHWGIDAVELALQRGVGLLVTAS